MIQIVAEIGCNHNGNKELALRLVKSASESGANAVKFQTFISHDLVSKSAPKAEYQKKDDVQESQLEMLKKLELDPEDYIEIKKYADSLGIEIFSTAFDLASIDFLKNIGQRIWKIPSGEITNLPYLEKIRDIKCQDKEIILSTGMSTVKEIQFAINILKKSPSTSFTILHCNTQYPTKPEDMNLKAMNVLKKLAPSWKIGLSDHSEGIVASLVAVGIGTEFIEKHFTLDKKMKGPDHQASITPEELKKLCQKVREAEKMLGNEEKKVTDSEKKNIFIVRKSIVAKKQISKGERFTEDNITCKRPGNGISPIHWYKVLGKEAERDFLTDELISCKGVMWEDE